MKFWEADHRAVSNGVGRVQERQLLQHEAEQDRGQALADAEARKYEQLPEFRDKFGVPITMGCRVYSDEYSRPGETAQVTGLSSEDGDMRDGMLVAHPAAVEITFHDGAEIRITRDHPTGPDDEAAFGRFSGLQVVARGAFTT